MKKHYDLIELTNKKVAILGYGDIGSEIAKRLKAFEVEVCAFDIHNKSDKNIDYFYYMKDLKLHLNKMDVIILSLPLTNETKYLVNTSFLSKLKNESILINVARGEIIKEDDLVKYLKTINKNMFILDVFKKEPLKASSKLWNHEKVYITPHIAYVSEENNKRLFELIILNLKGYKEKY